MKMPRTWLFPLISLTFAANVSADDGWKYEVTPYLWAAGMSGSTGPTGMVADVDMSFSEVVENLDGGFILHMQATKGQWNTWFDYVRLDIAADGEVRIFDINMNMSQTLAEAGVAYQLQSMEQIDLFPLWIALLLFSPFIVDASYTLMRRLLRGEKVWQAHREHIYQQLVQAGWGHRKTVLLAYALMLGCGLSAILLLHATAAVQWLGMLFWAVIYLFIIQATKVLVKRNSMNSNGES